MNKLLLTLVSCFVLFALGCQENSLTEPLVSEVAEKDRFQEDTYHPGFIKLYGMLADPSRPFNCWLEIRGEIEFEHRLILIDPANPASPYYVALKLAIEAELLDPFSPTDPIWNISEVSTDKIEAQSEQVHSLIKHFKLQDRDDNMFLVCKFIVTTEGVRLDKMWLKVPGLHYSNNVAR